MSILRQFPDLPPIWAGGIALGEWALARWLPLVDIATPAIRLVGIGFALVGFLLAAWAALWFWRKKTAIEPGERPTALIVEGPFRFNRNPIYTGMALVLIGIALWLGALSALALALFFPFIVTRRFILAEERALRAAFGAEAEDYFARSRRW